MLLTGNSNVDCFRRMRMRAPGDVAGVRIHWLSALKAEHAFNRHPAGARLRRLQAGETGWTFLSMGTHDIFQLCMYASVRGDVDHYSEALETTLGHAQRLFAELAVSGRFAWLVFPQPLHLVAYKALKPENLLQVSRDFNGRLESWCAAHGVPVVNPLPTLLGADGEPRQEYVQKDGFHPNRNGAQLYVEGMRHVTGQDLLADPEAEWSEPSTEVESFCSLLLNELGVARHAGTAPGLSQDDFLASLHGTEGWQAAEARISAAPSSFWDAFHETVDMALSGINCPYGIILYWQALHAAHLGQARTARKLLEQAVDRRKPFPFAARGPIPANKRSGFWWR